MNRAGKVFYGEQLAGIISENEDGFSFQYEQNYLQSIGSQPIAFSFPLQKMVFSSKILFPFFDGLIPEGWLLDIAVSNWKINARDRMGLLLTVCQDCIGAVSVYQIENHES